MNLPAIVVYSDNMPLGVGGSTIGCYVKIWTKCKGDKGILAHEMVHARQFWFWVAIGGIFAAILSFVPQLAAYAPYWSVPITIGVCAHMLLNTISKRYRLMVEVIAYKEAAKFYDTDMYPTYAEYLSSQYGLGVSESEALAALRK